MECVCLFLFQWPESLQGAREECLTGSAREEERQDREKERLCEEKNGSGRERGEKERLGREGEEKGRKGGTERRKATKVLSLREKT